MLQCWRSGRAVGSIVFIAAGHANLRIVTHIVRGLMKQARTQWMSEWRSRPSRESFLACCLQETHVRDAAQDKAHRLQWATFLRKHANFGHPFLSNWSTGRRKLVGWPFY